MPNSYNFTLAPLLRHDAFRKIMKPLFFAISLLFDMAGFASDQTSEQSQQQTEQKTEKKDVAHLEFIEDKATESENSAVIKSQTEVTKPEAVNKDTEKERSGNRDGYEADDSKVIGSKPTCCAT